jgi:hypothetical protein
MRIIELKAIFNCAFCGKNNKIEKVTGFIYGCINTNQIYEREYMFQEMFYI